MASFTNLLWNPTFDGGTTGNLASGGVWPTNGLGLALYHSNNGATDAAWENQGVTVSNGVAVFRFRLAFTNTSGADAYPAFYYGGFIDASASTLYQLPLRARIVSITQSGTVYFNWQGANEWTAAWALTQHNPAATPAENFLQLSTSWQYSAAAVRTGPAAVALEPYIGWGVTTGSSIDTVVEITVPMMIAGPWAPPFFVGTRSDLVVSLLTSGSSWTVPGNWSDENSVEVVAAAGAGVAANNNTNAQKRGGGGGAYSRDFRLSATPGGSKSVQIGVAGSQTDTWWDNSSILMAKAGTNATTSVTGVGGAAASGVGAIRFSGGNGGTPTNTGGAGGGGAGAPNGAGRVGGASSGAGGGGGAGAGGLLSVNGGAGTASGAAGGAGPEGTGGGAAAGGTATAGLGGGGGGATSGNGGPGAQYTIWTDTTTSATAGPGGGGGGSSNTTSAVGGAGGGYGGGGGGAKLTGGAAKGGLIVVAYWPSSGVNYDVSLGLSASAVLAGSATARALAAAAAMAVSGGLSPVSRQDVSATGLLAVYGLLASGGRAGALATGAIPGGAGLTFSAVRAGSASGRLLVDTALNVAGALGARADAGLDAGADMAGSTTGETVAYVEIAAAAISGDVSATQLGAGYFTASAGLSGGATVAAEARATSALATSAGQGGAATAGLRGDAAFQAAPGFAAEARAAVGAAATFAADALLTSLAILDNLRRRMIIAMMRTLRPRP